MPTAVLVRPVPDKVPLASVSVPALLVRVSVSVKVGLACASATWAVEKSWIGAVSIVESDVFAPARNGFGEPIAIPITPVEGVRKEKPTPGVEVRVWLALPVAALELMVPLTVTMALSPEVRLILLRLMLPEPVCVSRSSLTDQVTPVSTDDALSSSVICEDPFGPLSVIV